MGVGKTAVSKQLNGMLEHSVFLDGDWCWDMNPFVVNEENKEMVLNNITYLLRSFLNNSTFHYVIFCWVIHTEEIMQSILNNLYDCKFSLHRFTLMCSPDILCSRIEQDIKLKKRRKEDIARSVERLPFYHNMNTVKIFTDNLTIEDCAKELFNKLNIKKAKQ